MLDPEACAIVQAATGGLSGDLVLWTPPQIDANGVKFRRAAKIISIHRSPVKSLSCVGAYLVSGAEDGYIRFFDLRLRLVAWFEVGMLLLWSCFFIASCKLQPHLGCRTCIFC